MKLQKSGFKVSLQDPRFLLGFWQRSGQVATGSDSARLELQRQLSRLPKTSGAWGSQRGVFKSSRSALLAILSILTDLLIAQREAGFAHMDRLRCCTKATPRAVRFEFWPWGACTMSILHQLTGLLVQTLTESQYLVVLCDPCFLTTNEASHVVLADVVHHLAFDGNEAGQVQPN